MKKLPLYFFWLAGLTISFNMYAQADLKNYLGSYEMEDAPFSNVKIYLDGKQLVGEAVGQGSSVLTKSDDKDIFLVSDYDGTLTFVRDEGKLVKGLELLINGSTLVGTRIFPSLEDYKGNFIFSDGPVSELYVEPEEGLLMAETSETGRGPIEATSNIDQFYGEAYQSDIFFSRNDENIVDSVHISVQGMTLEGAKEMTAVMENPYIGLYQLEPGSPLSEVNIVEMDGILYGSSDQGEAELKPTGETDVFEILGYDGEVRFIKTESGQITGFLMSVQGQDMKATKAE